MISYEDAERRFAPSYDVERLKLYYVLERLATGGFGIVSRVRRTVDGKTLVWKELNYARMNKKERRLAMATALQNAAAAGDLQAVEALGSWDSGRTADLVRGLAAQGADPSVGRVLLITGAFNPMLARAARNVRGLVLSTADRLHVADVLGAGRIVVDVDALAFLAEFLGEKGEGFASHYALD